MLLYHYTDQNGFMGIVGRMELWATKIHYLNDGNEYKLAFIIAEKILRKTMVETNDENKIFRIKRIIAGMGTVENMNICVGSFSEEGDLLSQWRGYSNKLGGYSIGFDKEELNRVFRQKKFCLMKCIYDENVQHDMVKSIVDSILEKYKDEDEPNAQENAISMTSKCVEDFCRKIAFISPVIKSKEFSEEKEWRVMPDGWGVNFNDLDFRPGISMLIPYFNIKLGRAIESTIKEIIVGHTPHVELAKRSTEAFIFKHWENADKPMIKTTKIPYRNW